MANLPEVDEFTAGVYQWEITDPAEAGPDGIMNTPLKAVTNRTLWLKNQLTTLSGIVSGFTSTIAALTTRVTNLEASKTTTKFVLYLAKGSVYVGNIVHNKTITVYFPNVGTSNYMVNGSLVSLSTNYLQDIKMTWMIRNKTATSFQVVVSEFDIVDNYLNFDYVLIPL